MEQKRKSSFEEHINMVGSTKTASLKTQKNTASTSLLDKLAGELGLNKEAEEGAAAGAVTAPAAPKAEGEVIPGDSTVAGANAAVVAATDAVAIPQTTLRGGNPAEVAKGETAAAMPAPMPIIGDGTGKVTDANSFSKEPGAVAAAASDTGGSKAVSQEAEKIGALIAKSFQETLEKTAQEQEYAQAVDILNQHGLLENYDITDAGMVKKASVKTGGLEKIAQNKPLNREDIISAAYEVVEFNKQAELAEQQGRDDAQALVKLLTKVADDGAHEAGETAAEETEEEKKKKKAEMDAKEEGEKVASLLKDPSVVSAIRTLKEKNLL